MAQSPAVVNHVRFIIQASRGIIRDQRVRRTVMFYNVLAVLGLIFLGATFLWPWLRDHPLCFLGYWALCAWLTLLAALLALYDMAKIRLDAKRARRLMEEECLKENRKEEPHDSHTP